MIISLWHWSPNLTDTCGKATAGMTVLFLQLQKSFFASLSVKGDKP